ncbi:MAG: hypothetical protein CW342_02840 [Thermoactinomycetaceae bacterium]|nr:hypothetical protein [Thermoactinomycetaceae bacterium]
MRVISSGCLVVERRFQESPRPSRRFWRGGGVHGDEFLEGRSRAFIIPGGGKPWAEEPKPFLWKRGCVQNSGPVDFVGSFPRPGREK